MKPRYAVHAVAIEQRDGWVFELGGSIDEVFGKRRALQKAERRGGVKLNVRRHGLRSRKTTSTNTEGTELNGGHCFSLE
jgi:hypothetical protein